MRAQGSALSLALSVALGAALGSSVYVIAELRHQKQLAQATQPSAAGPVPLVLPAELAKAPASSPQPEAKQEKVAAAAVTPVESEQADAKETAPADPRAAALAARAAAEQALLDEARKQLEVNNGAGALAALDRMKKRFPRGALAQERELLRVEAYQARGQTLAAKRAARKFAKAYPDNPRLSELESLLN